MFIKSAYINKKITSVIIEKLGNEKYIQETYGVKDAEKWARAHVQELNQKALGEAKIEIILNPVSQIEKQVAREFNGGLTSQEIIPIQKMKNICARTRENPSVPKKHEKKYA